jgi:hypothetical protein
MASFRHVLGLVTSILFAALAGGMLAVPGWLPVANVWRAIVFVVASRAVPPPADFTLVSVVARNTKVRWPFLVPTVILDLVAVAIVLAFLDIPGASPGIPGDLLDILGRVVVAAVMAGAIPGWPGAGREGAHLFRRKQSSCGT